MNDAQDRCPVAAEHDVGRRCSAALDHHTRLTGPVRDGIEHAADPHEAARRRGEPFGQRLDHGGIRFRGCAHRKRRSLRKTGKGRREIHVAADPVRAKRNAAPGGVDLGPDLEACRHAAEDPVALHGLNGHDVGSRRKVRRIDPGGAERIKGIRGKGRRLLAVHEDDQFGILRQHVDAVAIGEDEGGGGTRSRQIDGEAGPGALACEADAGTVFAGDEGRDRSGEGETREETAILRAVFATFASLSARAIAAVSLRAGLDAFGVHA